MGLTVFISFDGDGIGQRVGRASLANDADEVRRISQSIDSGEALWRSWALSTGGNVISAGGDEGRLEIPADRLSELPGLRDQYMGAVGATCSVGVGMELGQADKALLSAKIHGKDRIVFWTPKVDEEVARLEHARPSEVEKITDEYLSGAVTAKAAIKKAESATMSSPGLIGGAGGMTGAQGPAGPAAPDAGAMQAPSASVRPPSASRTHAANDFEEQFHDLAGAQGQKDEQTKQAQGQAASQDQLKAKVVGILKTVQKQAPMLERIKAEAPEVYKAVAGCIQALIDMARELRGAGVTSDAGGGEEHKDKPVSKAEKPPPNATTPVSMRHVPPVGASKDQKVKVRHGDGSTSWVSVRSGEIMSQDGHGISSLNPGGR